VAEKTRNRGELSELYVLARLLSDATLTVNGISGSRTALPINRVTRKLGGVTRSWLIFGGDVMVTDPAGSSMPLFCTEPPLVNRRKIAALADEMLVEISSMTKSASLASLVAAQAIVNLLGLDDVIGDNKEKGDLGVEVYDPTISAHVMRYFSIKSHIGSPPSLLNASGATWFRYAVTCPGVSPCDSGFEDLKTVGLVSTLLSEGCSVLYDSMDERFRENLDMLDGHLERIVAECLLESYLGSGRSVASVVSRVAAKNPLGFPSTTAEKVYRYKFLQFLQNSAFGMMPSEPWGGLSATTAGFIDVKKDGSLLIFHNENQDELREYLWTATKFETPSTSRHNHGTLYRIEDGCFMNLALQIRYI
jgi:hypothetical protein